MNYKDFLPQPTNCGFLEKMNSFKSKEFKDLNKLFILGLFILIPFGLFAQAESEPNNDVASGDAIAFGSTGSGMINPAGDQDFWLLTTTENGKIRVDFTHTEGANAQYVRVTLYSSDGTNLASAFTETSTFIERDGLAAGDYYLIVNSYYSNHLPSYTFSPTFTSVAVADDVEDNNTFGNAQVFPLNSTTTGHVGYREYNGDPHDTEDWYSITTNADGRLSLTLSSEIPEHVWVYLYDGNGTTVLSSDYTIDSATETITIERDGLAPGQYFARILTYYSNDFASYTLTNNLILPIHPTEGANNDTFETAQTLALNGSVNGQIGYAYNGVRDGADWYSVTTNVDGKLQLTLQTHIPEYVYVELFDGNGTTQLANDYTINTETETITIERDGLAPGEYFVRVRTYYNQAYVDFAPYTLTNTLVLPPHPTEGDNNDTFENAQTLALNGSANGLIGYAHNGTRDAFDWYSVTTDENGKLQITLQTHIEEFVYVELFDGNGTTNLASNYTYAGSNGDTIVIERDGLAPGEYFVRVRTYYNTAYVDFAPYTVSNNLILPATPEDENDDANDVAAGAIDLEAGIPSFGHIGYKYIDDRDAEDWYQFNWPADGEFTMNLKGYSGQNIRMALFQSNGTTLIDQEYSTTNSTIYIANLQAGNYYVRINTYYNNEFGPYRLSIGVDSDDDGYADSVDCDPNDPTIFVEGVFYLDADGDGYHGSSETICYGDEPPAGYSETTLGLDCDDSESDVNPAAEEICDGIDNNCDGNVDEGVSFTWYEDADGDSFGNINSTTTACEQPTGYVDNSDDCDDSDENINPNATEIPGNGIDEDCDGSDASLPDNDGDGVPNATDNCPNTSNPDQANLDGDEFGDACDNDADGDGINVVDDCDDMDASVGMATTWYADADGDGFGDMNLSQDACEMPVGYVDNSDDCNDSDANINPNATEIPDNGVDENCDPSDDNSIPVDTDGDGIFDNADNCINVSNADQADMDGDGMGDVCDDDADGDGILAAVDCDDMDASVGMASTWYADMDGDGFGDMNMSQDACEMPVGYVANADDCDDSNANANPNGTEIPDNGIDEDCDGEDLITQPGDCSVPTGLSVTVLSPYSAQFMVDSHPTAMHFDYRLTGPNGSAYDGMGNPLNPNYGMHNKGNPFTKSSLWQNRDYQLFVRADCGFSAGEGNDVNVSEWSAAVAFSTPAAGAMAKNNAQIYPNPAKDVVNIGGTDIVKVEIYDQLGRMVYSSEVDNQSFSVRKLQTGRYIIQLTNKDGKVTTDRLIKE